MFKPTHIIKQFPLPLLILIFCLVEIIINPIGNFPLNDDWWYADLYKKLFEQNTHQKVAWGSASLFGQLLLTKLYVLVFGYSYTALRFFTLLLSLSSLIFLFKICSQFLKIEVLHAFTICLLLLFNPFFLRLSNSYMSDVPFVFFILGGLYFYLLFKEKKKLALLIPSLLLFSLGILTRQMALAFIVGIAAAEFFTTRKVSLKIILVVLIPLIALFCFELWMRTKLNNVFYTYVFFRGEHMATKIPTLEIGINFFKRWIHFISHSGFVLFPILIPYLILYFKKTPHKFISKEFIIAIVLFIPVVISLLKFPLGNYLYDFGVGPDTLYDVFTPEAGKSLRSPFLFIILKSITYVSSFALLLAVVNFVIDSISNFKNRSIAYYYFPILFTSSVFLYYSFLNFSGGIFDRYTLVFTLLILLILHQQLTPLFSKKLLFYSLFIPLILFSTLGTKDYLNSMRARWEIVRILKDTYKATDKQINAGYEHEGSCFPETDDWYPKWLNMAPNEYMVSRQNIPNYAKLGSYSYQQYMPFRKDTLFYLKYQGNKPK